MGNSSKPRKPYKPKPIGRIGGISRIADHTRLEDDQATDLSIAYRLAFDGMINGHASEDNWNTMVCSLNIGIVLSERGIGGSFVDSYNEALEGAFRSLMRSKAGKGWGLDGPAITAIKIALENHDHQIQFATRLQMRVALNEVHRRIDSGLVYREAA